MMMGFERFYTTVRRTVGRPRLDGADSARGGHRPRGNESHYPPQKNKGYPFGYPYFYMMMGFERFYTTVRRTVVRPRLDGADSARGGHRPRGNESHYPPQKRYQT